jgi:hypothetical protein
METSRQWRDFEMARDLWQDSIVKLEQSVVGEREARWKMNEAARKLEQADLPDCKGAL